MSTNGKMTSGAGSKGNRPGSAGVKLVSVFGNRSDRREHGIYFVSLVIAIVAFYVILSLEKQDVMIFLRRMESDAVERLMGLIAGVYGFSLFLIFFLIYFAERYQLERKSHEYGLFLMLGMSRSRLFLGLMAEDLYSGTLALLVGLPTAVFLSELISLVTARLIGMGIIGHRFHFSLSAALLTALGFLGIKLVANLLLSARMVKRNPYQLMHDTQEEKQRIIHEKRSFALLLLGMILLIAAYGMAIGGITWMNLSCFMVTLVPGAAGTFLLMKGFCAVFTMMVRNRKAGNPISQSGFVRRNGEALHIFTFRQLQENVFLRSGSLTISSLLILIAIACLSYGVAVAASHLQNGSRHSMDFTLEAYDEDSGKQIKKWMEAKETGKLIRGWAGVSVSHLYSRDLRDALGEELEAPVHEFDASGLLEAAENLNSKQRDYVKSRYMSDSAPHIIALSGINALYREKEEKLLALDSDEIYFYIDPEVYEGREQHILKQILQKDPTVKIDGKPYRVKGICSEDIVVDRKITIGFGIILADQQFQEYADPINITTYWNGYLSKQLIEEKGLMRAIEEGNTYFKKTGLEFENYLQNMGRQLFYIVAASYLTIYLALVFLIIANTVISLQYLMQEKKSRRRYHTLIRLGSTHEMICASARRQITWYFGVPLSIAAISSLFGVYALFSGLLPSSLRDSVTLLLGIAAVSIIILCVIEWGYVKMVMRYSKRNLGQMMEVRRE